MNLQAQYALSTIVTTVAVLGLGLLVFFKGPKVKLNRLWFLFNLSVAAWAAGQSVYIQIHNFTVADTLVRLTYVFGVLWIPSLSLHFVSTLLDERKRWPVYAAYGFSVLYLTQVFNPHFLAPPAQKFSLNFYPEAGPLYYPFFALWSGVVFYALWRLYLHLRIAKGTRRNQLRYLFGSMCIGYLGGMSNFLPVFDIECIPYTPYGTYGIPIYTAMFTYAIVKHQLMDIKVAITRAGLLLGTYLIVLGAPFLVGAWGRSWLQQQLGEQWWLVPLGLCTALATAGPFAYATLRRQAEGKLLAEQRRYQRTLQFAARGMTRVRDIARLSHLITRVVSRTVRVQHASLLLWEEGRQHYVLRASHGPKHLAPQSRYGLAASHPLIQWLKQHRRILTEEAASSLTASAVRQELMTLGAALVIPGVIEQRVVGFLALGPKLSSAGYTPDDLHAFTTLAHEAAIAIENALSYEELVKANDQLKLATQRLTFQERLATAGQFATGMAHEIKNPLTAIKTFAEYLPEKYHDADFREKFFRIVQTEINRITGIVQELSDFARPVPLQLQPVRLATLVEETLALLSDQCLKQDVKVQTSFSEDGRFVQADPQQLKQVIINLALNSVEAMPKGGRLDVSTRVDEPYLALRVADTGCGMSPSHQQAVWDPFFTTKERGMGLGLAIVKAVVERHGGTITLSSAIGQGTTVELNLPLVAGSRRSVEATAIQPQLASHA